MEREQADRGWVEGERTDRGRGYGGSRRGHGACHVDVSCALSLGTALLREIWCVRINATVIGSKEAKEGEEEGEGGKEGAGEGEGEGAHEETDRHEEAKPAAEGGETKPAEALDVPPSTEATEYATA